MSQPRTKSTGPLSGNPIKLTPKPSGSNKPAASQGNPTNTHGFIGTRNTAGSNSPSSSQKNPTNDHGFRR